MKTRVLLRMMVPLSLIATLPAWGGDLQTCAALDADNARLACYDAVAGRAPTQAAMTPPAAPAAPTAPAAPAAPVIEAPPAPPPPPAPEPRDDTKSGVIHAHIVGNFDGWNERTQFTLDNGQVWRVIEDDVSTFRPRENPAVKIKKGFLGAYLLEIDDLNARVKVERVR